MGSGNKKTIICIGEKDKNLISSIQEDGTYNVRHFEKYSFATRHYLNQQKENIHCLLITKPKDYLSYIYCIQLAESLGIPVGIVLPNYENIRDKYRKYLIFDKDMNSTLEYQKGIKVIVENEELTSLLVDITLPEVNITSLHVLNTNEQKPALQFKSKSGFKGEKLL